MVDKLPPKSDTVYAAGIIRASRNLTDSYNVRVSKNIDSYNDELATSVERYNAAADAAYVRCVTPEPPKEPKRGIWPW